MQPQMAGASPLLLAWERGQTLSPVRRAMYLASVADPARPEDQVRAAPLGWRNRKLLELRRQWFGSSMEASADCPSCGAHLEMRVPIEALLAIDAGPNAASGEIVAGGARIPIRPVSIGDLLAIDGMDAASAAASLARACVDAGDVALAAGDWQAAAERLRELDPLAEILFALECAECCRGFSYPLDVPSFLWKEINAAARRLILEVDALARTYGWAEAEILSMSPFRRKCYLDLLES